MYLCSLPHTFVSCSLHGIEIPESLVPLAIDEFPVLFVAAACAEGTTTLSGAEELRVKESDRIQAMIDGSDHMFETLFWAGSICGSLIVMVPAVFTGQHSGEGMLLLNRIPVLAAQKITS